MVPEFFFKFLEWSLRFPFLCKTYSCSTNQQQKLPCALSSNVLSFSNPVQDTVLKKMSGKKRKKKDVWTLAQLPPRHVVLPVWKSNKWQRAPQNSFSFHPSLPKNWVHKWIHQSLETSSYFFLWNVLSLDYFLSNVIGIVSGSSLVAQW